VSDNAIFEGDAVNDLGPIHDGPGLELRDVTVRADDGHQLLDEISLSVRSGEILGIAGVEGNGQAALADVLTGLRKYDAGSLSAGGQPLRSGRRPDPEQVGVIPADRHTAGCVLQLSIAENLVLDRPDEVARFGILSRQRMRARARALMDDFGIAAPSVDLPVGALSGGNQQRVVLARELSRTPAALVVAQPTQGLDVGAMEYIWSRLRAAAAAGTAVLLISTDLDEIMAISDRICVIYRGRIIGEMSRAEVDHERLGLLMGGAAA
jgi:simple sugar transport system ATP-binding protein